MNYSSNLVIGKARFIVNPLFTLLLPGFPATFPTYHVKASKTDIENLHAKTNTERAFVESLESSRDIL